MTAKTLQAYACNLRRALPGLRPPRIDGGPRSCDSIWLEAVGLTWEEADDRGLFVHYAGAVCEQCARVTLHDSGGHQSLVGHNWLDRMVVIGGCAGALSGAGLGFLWGLDSAVSWWAKIIVAPSIS